MIGPPSARPTSAFTCNAKLFSLSLSFSSQQQSLSPLLPSTFTPTTSKALGFSLLLVFIHLPATSAAQAMAEYVLAGVAGVSINNMSRYGFQHTSDAVSLTVAPGPRVYTSQAGLLRLPATSAAQSMADYVLAGVAGIIINKMIGTVSHLLCLL